LWGDGKGSFRTSGKYSAATVRGTRWLVRDSCAGTLTRVAQGSVTLTFRTIKVQRILRAGKSYLARPPRR
jgi:ferric-dicitrate binding protein FerR (iron transport regulator)